MMVICLFQAKAKFFPSNIYEELAGFEERGAFGVNGREVAQRIYVKLKSLRLSGSDLPFVESAKLTVGPRHGAYRITYKPHDGFSPRYTTGMVAPGGIS